MSRTHIALDVSHLDQAVRFYQAFLGAEPLRVLPGYAQFLLETPALNLALAERRKTQRQAGHFGIEVADLAGLEEALTRVRESGLNPEVEADALCCHSRQEKFWVMDPDGHRWELFWVRERFTEASESACCRAG
jgi:catechol 2,3-dioxygenase-like lactoylglutathione lyase family enzyme